MTELEQVLAAYDSALKRGVDSLLATVVHVQGSTYRRPGARLLLTADGQSVGTISGGCLEKEVHRKAWWLTAAGKPALVRYDTRSGEDAAIEFGLGCQGVVDVLLERLPAGTRPEYLELVRAYVASRIACVLATVVGVEGQSDLVVGDRILFNHTGALPGESRMTGIPGLIDDANATLAEGRSRGRGYAHGPATVRVFLEAIVPPPHLLIVGAGHDAVPVVRLSKEVGWDVTVVDSRSVYASAARFPQADRVVVARPGEIARQVRLEPRMVSVVMTHNVADDQTALRELLPSPVQYIGVLGPRSRTDALLFEPTPHRVFAPIGLDIGAETAEEIALAIIAEIKAVLAGHPAGFLRDRGGPIHRPPLADGAMDLPSGAAASANVEPAACPASRS